MAHGGEASCAATRRASRARSPTRKRVSARSAAVLALASFLAGCNANQAVNASSKQNLAEIYPNYSAYNPIQYAQTSGFYGGR
jgi:hypothetical protein